MFEICEIELFSRNLVEVKGGIIESVKYAQWLGERRRAQLESLVGWTFTDVRRHGKALIFCFENLGVGSRYLVSRLGQAGVWRSSLWSGHEKSFACSFEVAWPSGGTKMLALYDRSRTSTLELVGAIADSESLAAYGPDPLSDQFTLEWVRFCCGRYKMPIKALMLRPEYFAGIGNWVANEVLFRANIAPDAAADSLDGAQTERLLVALLKTIAAGLSAERVEVAKVYGRSQKPCYICGTAIKKMMIGGRGTFFCENCQDPTWKEPDPVSADFVGAVAKIAEEIEC